MVAMDNYYIQSRVVTISTNVQEIVRFFIYLFLLLPSHQDFIIKPAVVKSL